MISILEEGTTNVLWRQSAGRRSFREEVISWDRALIGVLVSREVRRTEGGGHSQHTDMQVVVGRVDRGQEMKHRSGQSDCIP